MASIIKVTEILHPTSNVPSLTINSDSTVSFDAGILSVTGPINGVIGANTPYSGTFTSLNNSGNLTFTGTGNRIIGDFSNATPASKVFFQSSTTNGATQVNLIPNGTSVDARIVAYENPTDPANSSLAAFGVVNNEFRLAAGIAGTGTYRPVTFYTGGSERVRIDTSGNVGIGTTTPAAKLDVYAGISSAVDFTGLRMTNGGENGTNLDFYNAFGPLAQIKGTKLGGGSSADEGVITFSTATNSLLAERMRLDASGNLLVGTTSTGIPTQGFALVGTSGGFSTINIGHATGTPDGYGYSTFGFNGTGIGSIAQNGTTGVSYNTTSDYRLKENVAPMTGALTKVAALKPVTYKWKADGSDGQGFIAHELQSVVPDCVTGTKDAVDKDGNPQYQGVDTSFLVATLVAAIQELTARLEVLENK
jgi:hypothetical protein